MIGLDTNVLLRYLIKDDEAQGERSARVIRQAAGRGEPVFIGPVVLCEMVWVLESRYGYAKPEIVRALTAILDADGFDVADRNVVRSAVDDYRTHKADFADCLIGRTNEAAGCRETVTFERRLKAIETFRVR
jgi:predicted nucleic-acid-binding protein